MATTKLTLSADAELIRQAKRLADESGTSLSSLFARFVRAALQERERAEEPGPLTGRATGLVTLPRGKTDQQLVEEALADKYGM
jgi:uncharacterized protein YfaQ (DUF2300 family)